MASEHPENAKSPEPEPPAAESPTPESPAPESDAPSNAAGIPQAPEAPHGVETSVPELTLGEGAATDDAEVRVIPALLRGKLDRAGTAIGTGRRKTAVARVRLRPGSGASNINGKPLEEYFHVERDRLLIEAPLKAAGQLGKVDVWVKVEGGGTTGQTGAIILGIARALEALNPEVHHALSEGGFLTRDGRMVERKKYGFKKARKSFQFSKR